MDGGVGLHIMWRNGENSGHRNPLQYSEIYDIIAAGNGWKNDDYRGIGMSLKIKLKNLGILKHAEFSLGDLTLICGENNTGKTYAAYALHSFLHDWHKHISFPVSDDHVQRLLTNIVIKIDLAEYVEMADQMLAEACKRYTDQLDTIFAAREGRFRNSEFRVQTGALNDIFDKEYEGTIEVHKLPAFHYFKKKESEELAVYRSMSMVYGEDVGAFAVEDAIRSIVGNVIFSDSLPTPFISSVERTGAAIFRRELDFAARNRPSERIGRTGQRYPLPVDANVDFVRELEYVARRQSFIAKEHPEVLADFADIIGGEYTITQDDQLYYTPKGTRLKLTMVESSSAVRSLLHLGFYLRHVVQKGELLMVDEPELNLHPANQRRIARLFAHLVNLGIKVFITTHSDYIVKELNTLIMLKCRKPHLEEIAKKNGYDQDTEAINANQVKVYTAKEDFIPLQEGQKRRRKGYMFVEANVDRELGIKAPSFDDTINKMNRIQRDIVWGAE